MPASTRLPIAIAAALLTASAAMLAAQGPAVQVDFVHPENFSDVGDRYVSSESVRASYLAELKKHIVKRASHLLADGQSLAVVITNVDMAGDFEPWRKQLGNKRIVRDVYPPRIDLTFALKDTNGTLVKSGSRELRDLAFATSAALYRDEPLRYEKGLLDRWLEQEVAPAVTAGAAAR